MDKAELQAIVDKTSYKPSTGFRVGEMGGGFFIQHWQMIADCNRPDDDLTEQRGGKRYISSYSCESEVVGQLFEACQAFEQHEAREHFEFDGYRLYGPHISMYALMEVCRRTEART